jgi:hypothetical protein
MKGRVRKRRRGYGNGGGGGGREEEGRDGYKTSNYPAMDHFFGRVNHSVSKSNIQITNGLLWKAFKQLIG